MAKGGAIPVDFRGVESGGGGGARVPEGDYRAKVAEVKVGTSKSSGNTMLEWVYEITEGKHKGKKLSKDYTVLTAEALWRLKNLLEALGIAVEGKNLKDLRPLLKKLLGRELGVTVTDEEYEKDGKSRVTSKVSDYLSLDELEGEDDDEDEEDDDEDEEETPKKKAKAKKPKKKTEDEDDDEEIEDLDLDDL